MKRIKSRTEDRRSADLWACAKSQWALHGQLRARGLGGGNATYGGGTYEVPFDGFLKDKAKHEGTWESGVKGNRNDPSKGVSQAEGWCATMWQNEVGGGGMKMRRKRIKWKHRCVLCGLGARFFFVCCCCTGDAMKSDTSTRHWQTAPALILISVFSVGGWWNLHLDWNDLGMVRRPESAAEGKSKASRREKNNNKKTKTEPQHTDTADPHALQHQHVEQTGRCP